MAQVTFLPPIGDDIAGPPLSTLKDLVFDAGEVYWNSGSGEAGLNYVEAGEITKLRMIFDKNFGFYLVYIDAQGGRFTSLGPGDFEKIATPFVGGDPIRVPSRFFLPVDSAWTVIKEFCETGQKSSRTAWLRAKDLDWGFSISD
jgi:hypothetical protein